MNTYQVESLKQLGYFADNGNDVFSCSLPGCKSYVRKTSSKYMLVSCATNSCSVSCFPSFANLTQGILRLQDENAKTEYVKFDGSKFQVVSASTYVLAKSDRKSSRKMTDNLVRVRSSNVWAYGYDIQLGENIGNLYVQFKAKNGGPGDAYEYFAVPLKFWRRFLSAPSKGHYFWKYIRNKFKYRKLTGDKKAKLSNGIN